MRGLLAKKKNDISRDHDVVGENGMDRENDDEDEDSDNVDDEDDGERSESSESSEDTVTVARKRKCVPSLLFKLNTTPNLLIRGKPYRLRKCGE